MITTERTVIELTASEGHVIVDRGTSQIMGSRVILSLIDSADNYHEVTAEEAERIRQEQELDSGHLV